MSNAPIALTVQISLALIYSRPCLSHLFLTSGKWKRILSIRKIPLYYSTQQMEDGTVYIFQLGRRLKMWLAAASSSVCAIGTESSPVSCSLWYKMCVYRLADVPHAITTSAGPFPRDKWGLVLMDPSRPSRRPLTCRPSFWHSNVLPLLLFFTTFPPPTEFFGCRRCKIMAV